MKPTEVRSKLRAIRSLKKEIEIIKMGIEELRTRAESAGAGLKTEYVPLTGYVTSKIEDLVAKIVERTQRLEKKQLRLLNAEEEAERLLDSIEDEQSIVRSVLRMRYLNGYTLEQVGNCLHYSINGVKKIEWRGCCMIAQKSVKSVIETMV